MKPKDWLFKNGHIKEVGRGRLSREHIALIEDAVKNGAQIEGYTLSKPVSVTVEKEVVKSPKPDGASVADIGEPTRDETTVSAYVYNDGKKVTIGMRTVCNLCKSSLTYCPCPVPRVWLDHMTETVVNFGVQKNKPVRWY